MTFADFVEEDIQSELDNIEDYVIMIPVQTVPLYKMRQKSYIANKLDPVDLKQRTTLHISGASNRQISKTLGIYYHINFLFPV